MTTTPYAAADASRLAPDTSCACRLCGAQAAPTCVQTVLARYQVRYFHCATCDLMQTQAPFWLDEAYAWTGPSLDTGAVERTWLNLNLVRAVAAIAGVTPGQACLDYGAGAGMLVRCMRDHGFDFRWYDKYARNDYAGGFEGTHDQRYRLLTAFEVLEHLPDPSDGLHLLFSPGHDMILVSTFLHRGGHRENWWYYVPEGGQHVAFYSRKTMGLIADRFGYDAVVAQRYTMFIRRDVTLATWRRKLLTRVLDGARPNRNSRWVGPVLALSPRYKPLTWDDHVMLRERRAADATALCRKAA